MGHRIEKAVMVLIATDFADQKDGIQDHAGDQQREKWNAQHQRNQPPPVEDDPAELQRDRQPDHAHAQRDEESDRAPAADVAHGEAPSSISRLNDRTGKTGRRRRRPRSNWRSSISRPDTWSDHFK